MKDNRTNENKGKNRTNPVQSLYRGRNGQPHNSLHKWLFDVCSRRTDVKPDDFKKAKQTDVSASQADAAAVDPTSEITIFT